MTIWDDDMRWRHEMMIWDKTRLLWYVKNDINREKKNEFIIEFTHLGQAEPHQQRWCQPYPEAYGTWEDVSHPRW